MSRVTQRLALASLHLCGPIKAAVVSSLDSVSLLCLGHRAGGDGSQEREPPVWRGGEGRGVRAGPGPGPGWCVNPPAQWINPVEFKAGPGAASWL